MEKSVGPVWDCIAFREYHPYEAMAYDEALIAQYERCRKPVLRLYGFRPAGFSIGYAQQPREFLDIDKCARDAVPVVRRLTGGGAIYHGEGITYSIVCSPADLDIPRGIKESFKRLCSFLIMFYKALGLDADYAMNRIHDKPLGDHHDICFAASEHYDLIIGKKKIGGNAQRRRKNMIFQHGFIPFAANPQMNAYLLRPLDNDFATLGDFLRRTEIPELSGLLKHCFTRTFSVGLESRTFFPEERTLAQSLVKNKYASPEWNLLKKETRIPCSR